MASLETCILFLAIIIRISAETFVKVDCTSENLGQNGQDSVLKCGINPTNEATHVTITYVRWKKTGNDKPLVTFRKDHAPDNEPRFRLSVENLTGTTRDVSLLVSNTRINDGGQYECEVMTNSGPKDTGKASLTVTAKYSAPIVSSIPERDIPYNTEVTLVCNSEGGYPKGRIRWFDQERSEWTSSSKLEVKEMVDGLFNLTSKLSLSKNSVFDRYICLVENASGGKDGNMTFDLPFKVTTGALGVQADAVSKIVLPVLVIGLLIIGLLMALLLKIKRKPGVRGCSLQSAAEPHLKTSHTSIADGQDNEVTGVRDDRDTELVHISIGQDNDDGQDNGVTSVRDDTDTELVRLTS